MNRPPLGQVRSKSGERQRCNLLEIGYFLVTVGKITPMDLIYYSNIIAYPKQYYQEYMYLDVQYMCLSIFNQLSKQTKRCYANYYTVLLPHIYPSPCFI